MNIDPVLIYLILFTLSSLVLLIVGLLIAYLNLLNRYSKTKKSSAVDDDISPMFRDTEARLKSIVDNASAQAAQTISSTQYFTEKQLKIFEDEVNKSAAMYLNLYQRTLENLERETAKEIKAIPEVLRRDLGASLSGISALFKDDVVKIATEVKDSLDRAYKNIEIDIEEYKKTRLTQVDKSIADIILQIARRVLVKEINKDEHEKLVLKALEDAKKSGMFSEDV
ncbi:MAG: hypothetical protein US62_C0013G0006 [Candidatus Woesebacteria bacterium GW2011_GWA1_37_8]|uniref:Uncharacterized protein n=2 Tax=Candidatus Woeseibacteriota TaxID=1752722 RepID=A0A0G0LG50_9BACT|nr:MAG: hypothetical protein US39_C0013G0004 [Microgenomates group bacterium GW2011_GWC1_37_12b]KKQ45553.1 MAG: hypothetical protein US62_C0013G0006 [Candidatus Woesebacteria bacterium GW2011_GWA1_37_8]KKQ86915.1 MAG: hypothetical protein UT10_C0014G0004 [Candidatus Woesebacteria bacterium GW2011_GWB1_38_8b]